MILDQKMNIVVLVKHHDTLFEFALPFLVLYILREVCVYCKRATYEKLIFLPTHLIFIYSNEILPTSTIDSLFGQENRLRGLSTCLHGGVPRYHLLHCYLLLLLFITDVLRSLLPIII